MYVPGKLHDVEHVLIDVGTGYYVEKVSGGGGGEVLRR
jgi:prefoldin alpha subunit